MAWNRIERRVLEWVGLIKGGREDRASSVDGIGRDKIC